MIIYMFFFCLFVFLQPTALYVHVMDQNRILKEIKKDKLIVEVYFLYK